VISVPVDCVYGFLNCIGPHCKDRTLEMIVFTYHDVEQRQHLCEAYFVEMTDFLERRNQDGRALTCAAIIAVSATETDDIADAQCSHA